MEVDNSKASLVGKVTSISPFMMKLTFASSYLSSLAVVVATSILEVASFPVYLALTRGRLGTRLSLQRHFVDTFIKFHFSCSHDEFTHCRY